MTVLWAGGRANAPPSLGWEGRHRYNLKVMMRAVGGNNNKIRHVVQLLILGNKSCTCNTKHFIGM